MVNKYSQKPDKVIDLHGYTRAEAAAMVQAILKDPGSTKILRCIVGRGIHSSGAPVLGEYIKNIAHQHGYNFRYAKRNEGGEGAIDIIF